MWNWFSRLTPKHRTHCPRRRYVRPHLEALEARYCPSGGSLNWSDPDGGRLDPTIGAGAGYLLSSVGSGANAVAVQSNGQIVIAGYTNSTGSKNILSDFLVARYNADGSLDNSFGSGGYTAMNFNPKASANQAEAVAIQSDGKILAAGYAYINGSDSFALARYNTNGTLDTTFGNKGGVLTATGGMAFSMAVQTDGKIVLSGDNGAGYAALARYNANGTLDTTFGKGGELITKIYTNNAATNNSLLIQPDGKIVITGPTKDPTSGYGGFMVARFNANGTADSSFGNVGEVITHVAGSGTDGPSGAALQIDGKIVVSGSAQFPSLGTSDLCLIRYNANGTLDTTFGSSGNGIVTVPPPAGFTSFNPHNSGVELQSDGKIVACGYLITSTGESFAGARVNADGSLDSSYGNSGWATWPNLTGDEPSASALQPDGRLLIVGAGPGNTVMLARVLQSAPQIGSFTASSNSVASGSNVTLTASNITDGNPNSTITQVTFCYLDANGNTVVLGTGTEDNSGNWALTVAINLPPGTYTLYAQAQDNYGALGNIAALSLQVV